MKKNKKAVSLIVAMMIVVVTTLLAYTVLEFIYPFSKNIKWVENSVNAYYNANEGVERALYFFKTRDGNQIMTETQRTNGIVDRKGYNYSTESSWKIIPKPGTGTTQYDPNGPDFNTIAMWDPIQLSIGNGFVSDITKLKIHFQVPEINLFTGSIDNTQTYIMWQITSEHGALYADQNNIVWGSAINNKDEIVIWNLEWVGYDWWRNEQKNIVLKDIFESSGSSSIPNLECDKVDVKCILTFSVIRELKTTSWKTLPFLEWKINTLNSDWTGGFPIPLRYSQIYSKGEYMGFWRELNVAYPQETANEALNITVLQ